MFSSVLFKRKIEFQVEGTTAVSFYTLLAWFFVTHKLAGNLFYRLVKVLFSGKTKWNPGHDKKDHESDTAQGMILLWEIRFSCKKKSSLWNQTEEITSHLYG